jgi:aryl-alcohol dehydrogenase-like predicted oxidoreductase
MNNMMTRPIPRTGEALPAIGLGTWRGFDVGADAAMRTTLTDVVQALLNAGGSVVDSSPMYGRAEAVTGDLLAAQGWRPRTFIATKVWTRGREAGIGEMRRSMALLQSGPTIDLIQVHNLVDWRVQLETLRSWKAEGHARYVGITHYTPSAHDELEAVMRAASPDFVQLDYALDDRAAERRLLPLAAELGIAVLVNRPLGGGGLARRLQGRALPEWAASIGCTTWSQILLKFVLAHPAVTCAIPGTANPQHMRDNALAGSGALPDAGLIKRMIEAIG